MTTIGAHKILIGTALLFTAAPAAWGVLRYTRHGETTALGVTAGAVVAAVVLGLYLRSFLARHRNEN